MKKSLVALIALVLVHGSAVAQIADSFANKQNIDAPDALAPQTISPPPSDSTPLRARPAWFSRRDLRPTSEAIVALGILSLTDEHVARFSQRPTLQQSGALSHAADGIQLVGDPGALLTSASLYVIGRVAHKPNISDASRHSLEAILASGAITQLLKLGVGRVRPNVSHDWNAYMFHPAHGNQTDFNSFPSGHTTASFAAASVFSAEIRRLHPHASKYATPALYGIATLVGASRMYNDRHWLSDVAAGALIGHFVGRRIVHRAHWQ